MSQVIRFFVLTLILLAPSILRAGVPAKTLPIPTDKAFKVMHYLSRDVESKLVVVSAGSEEGIVSGAVFRTYRPARPQGFAMSAQDMLFVETGILKALDVQSHRTVATIVGQGSEMSKQFFPKFSGVMAGDAVVLQRLTLTRTPVMTPEVGLLYRQMFEDPKATPTSFELSEKGKAKIREATEVFAKMRLTTLMVEGYTDADGPSDANQVESYQRALTVRQFMIDELGFDEERVVAIGYGETQPDDVSAAPGSRDHNRRIVFKAIPTVQ